MSKTSRNRRRRRRARVKRTAEKSTFSLFDDNNEHRAHYVVRKPPIETMYSRAIINTPQIWAARRYRMGKEKLGSAVMVSAVRHERMISGGGSEVDWSGVRERTEEERVQTIDAVDAFMWLNHELDRIDRDQERPRYMTRTILEAICVNDFSCHQVDKRGSLRWGTAKALLLGGLDLYVNQFWKSYQAGRA